LRPRHGHIPAWRLRPSAGQKFRNATGGCWTCVTEIVYKDVTCRTVSKPGRASAPGFITGRRDVYHHLPSSRSFMWPHRNCGHCRSRLVLLPEHARGCAAPSIANFRRTNPRKPFQLVVEKIPVNFLLFTESFVLLFRRLWVHCQTAGRTITSVSHQHACLYVAFRRNEPERVQVAFRPDEPEKANAILAKRHAQVGAAKRAQHGLPPLSVLAMRAYAQGKDR
jgi:hypothetical protein